MDFEKLDTKAASDEGVELQLLHPKTGAPLDAFITVLGVDSDAVRAALFEQQRRYAKKLASRSNQPRTPEEIEADRLELVAAATKGWRGIALEGKALEFSAAAAARFYQRFPWAMEQVDRFGSDRANFLQG